MKKTRVLVVDDSATMRGVLTQIINDAPDLQAIGGAADAPSAREMIRMLQPDVLTLDMEMPRVTGLEFLEQLMRQHPMPVVMVSALAEARFEAAERALELGALELVPKPRLVAPDALQEFAAELTAKIRSATRRGSRAVTAHRPSAAADPGRLGRPVTTERFIVIGASTGGTEAIKDVLEALPRESPGVLVTQHMPEGFTHSFAARLDTLCRITVKEAGHGERVLPGHAYIAPGHSHLSIRRRGTTYVTELSRADPVNRHRPSVDVLFRSAAQCGGSNIVGVILTGMGKDGAAGLLELRRAGGYTYAQDERSCVVFGMPKEAIGLGAVDEVLPLEMIAGAVLGRLAARVHAKKI